MSEKQSPIQSVDTRLGRLEGQLETLVSHLGRLVDNIEERVDVVEDRVNSIYRHVYVQYGTLAVSAAVAALIIEKVFG
jgi:hypothetical protein